MKIYTYSEAKRRFAALFEQAVRDGAVQIWNRDGQKFILKAEAPSGSPLDVEGLDFGLTREEIVGFVHAGRAE